MIQWLVSRRYYLLTSFTLLLGALVLVVTLTLAMASYLRSIDKTVTGYGHMLSSLEAALIHELVLANQRQIAVLEASLDKAAIARGEPADNPLWAIAHQIKRDSHYIYFYHPQTDRLSSYPAWQQPVEYRAASRPWYRALSMPGADLVWLGPYPAFDTQKPILTLIKRVKGLDDQLLGLLMVDMSFNTIEQALQRAMGSNRAAIYISAREDGKLVVGSNMELYQPSAAEPGGADKGLAVIWHGSHLRRELEDIDWDLNIYLPPRLFHDDLEEALLMVALPLLLLFAIWFCSINFLVRVFNQEQALVAGSLTGIVRDPTQARRPGRLKTWFVHDSLSEIDQVRASFLQGQDALLHDPLTGIMNRRAFTQRRAELEERAAAVRRGSLQAHQRQLGACGGGWRALPGVRAAGDRAWQRQRLPDRGGRICRPAALAAQRAGGGADPVAGQGAQPALARVSRGADPERGRCPLPGGRSPAVRAGRRVPLPEQTAGARRLVADAVAPAGRRC